MKKKLIYLAAVLCLLNVFLCGINISSLSAQEMGSEIVGVTEKVSSEAAEVQETETDESEEAKIEDTETSNKTDSALDSVISYFTSMTTYYSEPTLLLSDNDWLNDYEYSIYTGKDSDTLFYNDSTPYIVLSSYSGSDETVVIPGEKTVDGVTYHIAISKYNIWGNNDSIKHIYIGFDSASLEDKSSSSVVFLNDSSKSRYRFGYTKAEDINLGNIDLSNCDNLAGWFYESEADTITFADDIDFSSITNINNLFYSCDNLLSMDMDDLSFNSVTTASDMFYDCEKITSITLPQMTSLTKADEMFMQCYGLTNLDISNLDTGVLTSFTNIFKDIYNVRYLDISECNCKNFTELKTLLANSSNLHYVKVPVSEYPDTMTLPGEFYIVSQGVSVELSTYTTLNSLNNTEIIGIQKGGHTYALVSHVAATCSEYDYSLYKCKYCDDTYKNYGTTLGDHVKADAVKENEIYPTIYSEGSYDLVIRCKICDCIISKKHITTEKLSETTNDTESTETSEVPKPDDAEKNEDTGGGNSDNSQNITDDNVYSFDSSYSGKDYSSMTDEELEEEYNTFNNYSKLALSKSTLKVSSPAPKQLKVYFDKVYKTDGYEIQVSTTKKFSKKTTKSYVLNGEASNCKRIKKLKDTKLYYVRVRAFKTFKVKKYSNWSYIKKAMTIPASVKIKKVKKIKATNCDVKTINLRITWKKSKNKKVKGYQIQVSANKRFKGKNIVTRTVKGRNVTKKVIKNLKKKKYYYVRIRCYVLNGKKKVYSNWKTK